MCVCVCVFIFRGSLSRAYRISSPMRHTDGGLANTLLLIGNMKIGYNGIFLRFDATDNIRKHKGTDPMHSRNDQSDYICHIAWSQVVKSERVSTAALSMTILLGNYLLFYKYDMKWKVLIIFMLSTPSFNLCRTRSGSNL